MTPPTPGTAAPTRPPSGNDHRELLSDMTFDELRELPMSQQLGLDLTACESREPAE